MRFRLTSDRKHLQLIDEPAKHELVALKKYFHRRCTNYYFDPRYQRGVWDGYDDFYNQGFVPIGLWKELMHFQRENNYPVSLENLHLMFDISLTQEEFDEFVNELLYGTDVSELRWFQSPCACAILKYKYCMAELATSSGKTLISYMIAAYLKKTGKVDKNNKFVMIVPKVGLIDQTIAKFTKVYNNGTVPMNVAGLGGKHKVNTKKGAAALEQADVVIATYQSLGNMLPPFFMKVRHINVDEAHTATNDTIKHILRNCTNLSHRFGLSGTLEIKTDSADYFRMQEYLGPNVMIVTAKDLIDSKYSPDIYIKAIKLKYRSDEPVIENYLDLLENGSEMYAEGEFGKAMYQLERQILLNHEARLDFIISLIRSLKMSTLILFNDVKGQYGKNIYDKLVKYGEHAYYIDGNVNTSDRDNYVEQIESNDNVKLIASFGTFSTGIDMTTIYNIIFVESYKSPILIRQSIGRGMRKHDGKYSVNIIDIVDTFGKYSKKHYKERKTIYIEQQFPVTEHEYVLNY